MTIYNYNSGLCVFLLKFANVSQQYNEASIIIVCNTKTLIGYIDRFGTSKGSVNLVVI